MSDALEVVTIPCLQDNFSYVAGVRVLGQGSAVVVVDPCEPAPVLEYLTTHGLRLVAILNTHHHGDHVGGNRRLIEHYSGLRVYAHASDRGRIPGQTHFLEEDDRVQEAGMTFRVLFTPGHTRGHIIYVGHGVAFVGDTVFGGGCGRLFEGTAAVMHDSLNRKIAALSDETKLYFAHEYTEANLRFALDVEPHNPALSSRVARERARRARGEWTTPSTLGEEKATNPFFRVTAAAVQARFAAVLGDSPSPEESFAAVRAAKDTF